MSNIKIDFYKEKCRTLIPRDDPDYEAKLENMAIALANSSNNPELDTLCEWHNEMLEKGEI
jgi:hypothetical protein